MRPQCAVVRAGSACVMVLALLVPSAVGAASPQASLDPASSPATNMSPRPGASAGPGVLEHPIPPGLFAAAADPLDLISIPASKLSASKAIGPKGGKVVAKGQDGTVYTLVIEKNTLPIVTTITVTPVADLTGFPAAATPEHRLGVELSPDGLDLARTATLTIEPPDSLATVPVFTLDYHGDGTDAVFHDFAKEPRRLTLPIEHFSGYVAAFPLDEAQASVIARRLAREGQARLESTIAEILGIDRQKQLMTSGVETEGGLLELARSALSDYREQVLRPLLAAAGQSCAAADKALKAFGAYARSRGLLGVENDTQFDLWHDPELAIDEATQQVPPRLVQLATRICFRETFQLCVRSGDFPGLLTYIFGVFVRNRDQFGIEPTADEIALAQGYLGRCGRYRATVTSSWVERDAGRYQLDVEATAQIDLQWKPGSDYELGYGLADGTFEGSGDVDMNKLRYACTDGYYHIVRTSTSPQARARLANLTFVYAYGTTLRNGYILPQPTKLILDVGFGVVDYVYTCGGSTREKLQEFFPDQAIVTKKVARKLSGDWGQYALHLDGGWTFGASPFKAEQHFDGVTDRGGGSQRFDTQVDITLEHKPG